MTDDTLRDRLEVALCHALCTSNTADHDPTVHRAVNAALAVWADEVGTDWESLARVAGSERDRQRLLAEQAEAERDVWEEHAQEIVAERDALQQRIAEVRDERDDVQGRLETASARAQGALTCLDDDGIPPATRCDLAMQSLDPPYGDLAGSNTSPAPIDEPYDGRVSDQCEHECAFTTCGHGPSPLGCGGCCSCRGPCELGWEEQQAERPNDLIDLGATVWHWSGTDGSWNRATVVGGPSNGGMVTVVDADGSQFTAIPSNLTPRKANE